MKNQVKWISHRGESIDAPENSLAAFKLSLDRKTDGMECDVYLCRDHQVVVAHDEHTGRMGNCAKVITETDWADLQKVCISGNKCKKYPDERIPLFVSTLQYLGEGREYYVELKPGQPPLVDAVAEILEQEKIDASQIVIISFDAEMIALSKKRMPQYRALWLCEIAQQTPAELIAHLKSINADGVDAYGDELVLTREYIAELHAAGMIVAVWTIDQPEQAKRFIEAGVDSITSNCAALLRDLLAERN